MKVVQASEQISVSLIQKIFTLCKVRIIRIGRYDLNNFTYRSIRQVISVVPQKIDLFAGNVIDNIATGDLNPDIDKVLKVCEKLGMSQFIETLPMGFRTYLGENGATLSIGQKQRIAIARALYQESGSTDT